MSEHPNPPTQQETSRPSETPQTCVTGHDLAALVLRLLAANFFFAGLLALSRITVYSIEIHRFSMTAIGADLVGLLFYAIVGGALWHWARPLSRFILSPNPSAPAETRQSLSPASLLSAGLSFLAILVAVLHAIPGIIYTLARLFVISRERALGEAATDFEPALIRDGVLLIVAVWLFRNSQKLTRSWEHRQTISNFFVDVESYEIPTTILPPEE
jgi:hypothetical protein